MDIVIDPNLVYLLVAAAMVFTVLAIFNPGTGVLEILALFVLFAAGVGVYSLATRDLINWWSLLVTLVGLVLLILAMSRPRQPAFLVASIVCIVIGSAYLVKGDVWYLPGVNIVLALIVSIASASFFWVAGRKVLEARSVRPTHDLGALVGALGEAKSEVYKEGSVQVSGELWSAHSDKLIPNGAQIRVVEREGFSLKVEAVQENGE